MTRILILDIPAPCEWLNSNDRRHHFAKAKLTRAWREAGRVAVESLENPAPFAGRVRVKVKVHKIRKGRYDVLNLWPSVKAAIDGIVEAGILSDDSFDRMIGPDLRHGGFGQPRIIVEITEIGDDWWDN